MNTGVERSSILWSRFKTGDATALGQLFEQYYGTLVNYGSKFSKDREFVRDCIQELFVDLWNRRYQLSESLHVKAYLMTALRNRILKEFRRPTPYESAKIKLFSMDELEPSIESKLIEDEHQAEQVQRIQDSILKLTKRQQEIIYLRFFQQLSHQEIAQVMHLGAPSVINLLYRSLRDLKQFVLEGTVALSLLLGWLTNYPKS